ncbi:MAG: tyrosine-type recombinase/integrase [Pseudonocardia sp.]
MKGHVRQMRKSWQYLFSGPPDLLTGKRPQITKSGFRTEKEAWAACHRAMAEYEDGTLVRANKRTVRELIDEWLTRREHAIKRSMHANYRNYANYYVLPYIGERRAQDLDSAVFDALYRHLLESGRIKANAEHRQRRKAKEDARQAAADKRKGARRRGPAPKALPVPKPPDPGLAPKTVVNVHRMLHRVWADAARWQYVKRNVVADASPPRVPRTTHTTWTVEQLSTFLHAARKDRFFALWVLEATTGMRRSELAGVARASLDFRAGTLVVGSTRVVIDGQVVEEDGKSDGSRRTIALDPYTVAVLRAHVRMLDAERAVVGDDYRDRGLVFCWEDGRPPHPDTITARFNRVAAAAGLPRIRLHDVRHSYATAGRMAGLDPKALSQRVGHASVSFTMTTYMHGDAEADRQVANALASVILAGLPTPEGGVGAA